ncbi:DEAD/DEAH box helicase [Bifidobacterium bifidum]|uniref:DEAD/DEAH box helicase n=1 Tax=Bifidobacterium bifidum TaxID=1681 RepID=UPI003A4E31A0
MHTDTDTVDIDDIDAALDASADDKEQDAAPTFAELGVPKPLVHVLAMDGKVTAFPIQADTLADSLNGVDLLGRGQTGSGKTLAFAIPLVARLSEHSVTEVAMKEFEQIRKASDEKAAREQASLPRPRGLVLAPTRELVNQIDEVIQPLAEAYGMSTVTVYGGVSYARQVAGLRAGADIVVACPGRLEDLLRQGKLSLDAVEITILDEADEMADMGFLPPVTRLLEQTDSRGQRMLFSATLDHGVDALVKRFLPDAKVHAVSSVVSQVDTMTHHVFEVSQGNKHEVIRLLASGTGKRILFTRTKFQAKKMAKKLIDEGIPAVDLQGNLSQKQRDRNLLAFEKGLVRVLVATDVAARGIDVHDVTLVVQTDPPADPKSFLHRSGRTARAGRSDRKGGRGGEARGGRGRSGRKSRARGGEHDFSRPSARRDGHRHDGAEMEGRESAQYRFDHRDESQMSIIGEGKPHGKRKHTTKRDRFDGYGRSGFDDGRFDDRRQYRDAEGRKGDKKRRGNDFGDDFNTPFDGREADRRSNRRNGRFHDTSFEDRKGGSHNNDGDNRRDGRNRRSQSGPNRATRKAAGFRKSHGKRNAAPFRRGR